MEATYRCQHNMEHKLSLRQQPMNNPTDMSKFKHTQTVDSIDHLIIHRLATDHTQHTGATGLSFLVFAFLITGAVSAPVLVFILQIRGVFQQYSVQYTPTHCFFLECNSINF